MKLIFVSTDGVLTNQNHMERISKRGIGFMESYYNQIDKDKLSLLNHLINKTNVEVVLTGTWKNLYSLDKLNDMLSRAGASFKAIGCVPYLYKLDRITAAKPFDEVDLYLNRLVQKGITIDDFVILDDHLNDYKNYSNKTVKVNYERGLRPFHIEKALDLLGVERKRKIIGKN